MMQVISVMISPLLVLALAPLVAGIIKKAKARMQNRRGPALLQSYYDLHKLFYKDSIISPTTSWVFRIAPYIYFATALAAAILTFFAGPLVEFADLFLLVYIFAMGRFFLALASLDSGSAFGGMGGSREMYISVLVEPALLLSLLTVALPAGTTSMDNMKTMAEGFPLTLPYVLGAVAFFMVAVAETGRIPVDNPDTHLELTMVHEGMLLEYSGCYLGLIHWASMVKQLTILVLFTSLFLPWMPVANGGILIAGSFFAGKLLIAAVLLAVVETSTNKLRLFRLQGFLAVSCLLSVLALVAQ